METPFAKKEFAEPTSGLGLIASPKMKQEQIDELYEMVKKKTDAYDPATEKDESSEFDTKEQISWSQMITRHMDCNDRIMLYLGNGGAMLFGASLPAFCLLFGNMIDGVGKAGADSSKSSGGYDGLQTQA
jgi:hypothetical protein